MNKLKPGTPARKRQSGSAAPPSCGAPSRSPAQAAGHEAGSSASQVPPAGLDATRHAAAQRASHQAEVLRDGVFPALMATALTLDKYFDTGAYRAYLTRVMRDLGDPKDPIERMLVEQLCIAHFRVAQLHAGAGQANGLEATRLLNTTAARMLGEMRRTALSLKAYRSTAVPTNKQKAQLKLFKAAQ